MEAWKKHESSPSPTTPAEAPAPTEVLDAVPKKGAKRSAEQQKRYGAWYRKRFELWLPNAQDYQVRVMW